VPPEHRRAVVTPAAVTAFKVPAVLAEPVPERGLAGWGQRVSADADYPAAAVGAVSPSSKKK
jgi:hypothetical protein